MTQRPPGKRAPNRAGTFYLGADGDWHGRITLGVRDDGRPDRRHVRGKSEHEVRTKVREIEDAWKGGHLHQPGQRWTVEQWLTHWLDNIAAPSVRATTLFTYRVAVRNHLIPGVGAHRLDRLEAEHLETLYVRMLESGLAPATAHQTHRTVHTALNQPVRRGHLPRNPAQLDKAPRLPEWEVEPLTLDEVRRLLDTAGRAATAHGGPSRWLSGSDTERRSDCGGRTSTSTPCGWSSGVLGSDPTGLTVAEAPAGVEPPPPEDG